ncbi:hypothetical protein L2E82_12090 [Cichorium intybus]|uniref:Uncharacterized protein n=1 Tax=Cichorium intybus TaxID=13427 RepID=A0ACB9GG80_CICIN|nr:hypothetical protein L2E82_12090 [Cichorium intybus]
MTAMVSKEESGDCLIGSILNPFLVFNRSDDMLDCRRSQIFHRLQVTSSFASIKKDACNSKKSCISDDDDDGD